MIKILTKILFISFFLIIFVNSYSQIGLTVGANFANLSGQDNNFQDRIFRPGFYSGIYWDLNITTATYLQMGAIYSQQGAIFRNEGYIYQNDFHYSYTERMYRKIDYLTLPLYWKQAWSEVYTVLGVYGQIGINAKTQTDSIKIYLDKKEKFYGEQFNFIQELTPYDFGVNLGIGYQIQLTNEYDFFMEIAYKVGVFPTISAYEPSSIMKNRVFTVSTGLIIISRKVRYRLR